MSWQGDTDWTPRCEELAAYANGTLEGCAGALLRRRIEAWLAGHPDAAAEVEVQRRLARFMQATTAPAPSAPTWDAVWARIQEAPAPLPPAGPRGRRMLWALALGTTAAAVLFLMIWAPWKEVRPVPSEEVVEPFPVATGDDIEIVRMDGADADVLAVGQPPLPGPMNVAKAQEVEIVRVNGEDTDSLVVGELPVRGPLVLANPGEVSLTHLDPGPSRHMTEVHMGSQDTPMVWARLESNCGE